MHVRASLLVGATGKRMRVHFIGVSSGQMELHACPCLLLARNHPLPQAGPQSQKSWGTLVYSELTSVEC